MAVRVGVGERRVVDHLDAGSVGVDREQGRKLVLAVDHVGHHDQDGGDVARRDEPLLAVQAKAVGGAAAAVEAMRLGSEPASRSVTA